MAGLEGANSSEFDPNAPFKVVDVLPGQDLAALGGTMRLGAYPCKLLPGSKAAAAYGSELIYERHRRSVEADLRSLESRRAELCDSVLPLGIFSALDVPDRKGPTWSRRDGV